MPDVIQKFLYYHTLVHCGINHVIVNSVRDIPPGVNIFSYSNSPVSNKNTAEAN